MKTRTLLLLAFGCGLAILVAGGVQLLRLAEDGDSPPPLAVGDTGQVGDMRVTVLGVRESAGTMVVDVSLVGVDDEDGGSGFSLVVPGGVAASATVPEGMAPCRATAAGTETACAVAFDTSGADGSARVLLYRRAGETQRWDLTG